MYAEYGRLDATGQFTDQKGHSLFFNGSPAKRVMNLSLCGEVAKLLCKRLYFCCPAHFFKKECLIFSLISFLRVASFATGSFNSFHRSPIVGNVVSVSTLLLICFWVSV